MGVDMDRLPVFVPDQLLHLFSFFLRVPVLLSDAGHDAVNAGMLVIGEGGKQLSAGQRFSVNVLGDEVCDTRTGEVIDVVEIPVATAEIVSVQPKLSYAKVIEGDASLVKVGARLRPVQVVESAVEPAPTPATIKVNANGGVVLPF